MNNPRYTVTFEYHNEYQEICTANRHKSTLAEANQIVSDLQTNGFYGGRVWNITIVDNTPAPVAIDTGMLYNEPQPTIERQLEIWRDNTPVWHQFPAPDQTAVYMLGLSEEYVSCDEQPRGVIIVFNARRGSVRCYPYNRRNEARITALGLGDYGYINWLNPGSRQTVSHAYCSGAPRGMTIPCYDAILYTKQGCAIWSRGIVGYLSDRGESDKWTGIELDWSFRVIDAIRWNKFTNSLWGCVINHYPELGVFPDQFVNLDQIPYDPEYQYPIAQPATNPAPVVLTDSQIILLDEQLVYWRNRCAMAEATGNADDEEFSSLFAVAIASLLQIDL